MSVDFEMLVFLSVIFGAYIAWGAFICFILNRGRD